MNDGVTLAGLQLLK